MGKALYRKYRSRKLTEIVGQEHVTTLLANALKQGRIAHAYLFTGPRGTGKTSIARILAHEINDLPYSDESSHLDIIEIDAASNNGVDDIRDLREKVNLAPINATKKVYIIDEVHMLSKPAFNALLKTLEEPPVHVVFILATTDVDKLPETIISRTQRHTFRRASIDNLVKNLRAIAGKESIDINDDALRLIAQHADGSFRDSVSLLDQLANTTYDGAITVSSIETSLGLAPQQTIENVATALAGRDFDTILAQLRTLTDHGVEATIVARQLLQFVVDHAAKQPALLPLVDGLVSIGQSSAPSAALLALLGSFAQPHTSNDAAPAPINPTVQSQPKPSTSLQKSAAAPPTRKRPNKKPSATFDWQAILTAAKTASIGLHSVLLKCSATAQDDTITVYARNAFYEKKLKAPAYQKVFHTILADTTGQDWEIVTIPGLAPSNNSQVAAVTAMMGGGEEVSLDE